MYSSGTSRALFLLILVGTPTGHKITIVGCAAAATMGEMQGCGCPCRAETATQLKLVIVALPALAAPQALKAWALGSGIWAPDYGL